MTATDPIIAYATFTDGTRRPVYEDTVGQYVVQDDREVVRRVWFLPRGLADEPVIIDGRTL